MNSSNRSEPGPGAYEVRFARVDEVAMIPAVELAAASLFDTTPHAGAVANDVTPHADLEAAQQDERLWVAVHTTETESVVGFAFVEYLGSHAHLDELDVHPRHGRQGLGARLVNAVCRWAHDQGLEGVTLTTYREIAWNAPFYTRMGFEVLDPTTLPAPLAARFRAENRDGLDASARVCMRYRCRA